MGPRGQIYLLAKSLFPGVFDLGEDRQFDGLDLAVDLIRGPEARLHGEEVRLDRNAEKALIFLEIRQDKVQSAAVSGTISPPFNCSSTTC